MGVRILFDDSASNYSMATIYCSTTDWSLGPVFFSNKELGLDAREVAERFLKWLPCDARTYTDPELERKVSDFLTELPKILEEERKWEDIFDGENGAEKALKRLFKNENNNS